MQNNYRIEHELQMIASRFRYFAALAAIALGVAFAFPQRASAGEPTLFSLIGAKAELQSFDVYHVSDTALFRTKWTLNRLVASPDRVEDFLHISARRIGADDLKAALTETTITLNQTCRDLHDIDVRWAFVLNFQDGTRTVIGFNRLYNCVELQSEPNPVGVRSDFFRFVEQKFGFLIDRLPASSLDLSRFRRVKMARFRRKHPRSYPPDFRRKIVDSRERSRP